MKSRRLKAILLITLFPFLFSMNTGCELADDEEMYKIVVQSYNDSFIGTYTVDGHSHIIDTSSISSVSSVYVYEKKLGSLTSLDVDVSGASGATTTFLKVTLYMDDEYLDSASDSRSETDDIVYVSLSYSTDDDE